MTKAEHWARWKRANPARFKQLTRRIWLKRDYGMTEEDFDRLLLAQKHRCAVCRKKFGKAFSSTPHIDHDHSKRKGQRRFVRGLLCRGCNLSTGYAGDSPSLLRKLADYLEGKS